MARWSAVFAVVLAAASPAFAQSPSLTQAQQLYQKQRYKKVLPLLKKALREDPSPREEVEIYELMAMTHVVFGRAGKARDAYVEVLERNPDYDVPVNASPKIRKAFRQAKKRANRRRKSRPSAPAKTEPGGEPASEVSSETSDGGPPPGFDPFATSDGSTATADGDQVDIPPPDASLESSSDDGSTFYQEWWFWTAVGVGVVGLGVGAAILLQPSDPASDFGPYALP